MSAPEKRRDPLQRWVRVVRARPRLFLAILLGLAVVTFLPADWRPATRSLVAWDIALGLYLVLTFRLMTICDVNRIRRRAAYQDEGRITIFAIHYAHEYYDEKAHKDGGLNFPGGEPPDYWDFVYFSFVVGMTGQVSDVAVTSRALRRLVAAHGVVSFIFNATLLALMVNIAASAI